MGKNLNPILQQELKNFDKDADSRRAAMKALHSFVKDMDSKAIPLFLAEVSRNKEAGSLSGECTISLYEVLARVHGPKIVPLIDDIMDSIIKTLASSGGSFPLQNACSRVVPAIARYGIDASTPEERKRQIVHSLCNPLADSLLGSQESITSGAALCLKALVENDNWRFASYEMVNKVCQNVAGALEENFAQTNAHMGLVMDLAKRNAVAVEPYGRLLVQSGLRILNTGIEQGNSQKRLSAVQMVKFLMKCLDPWSIRSELQSIIEEMEKCQCDQLPYIRGAAFEALQTAKRIASESGSKSHKGQVSVTGSNFSRRDNGPRTLSGAGYQSPASASPGSHFLYSFDEYDSLIDSPILTKQDVQYLDSDCRSVEQKLWSFEKGGVGVSLKEGFFSEIASPRGVSDLFFEQSNNKRFFKTKGNSEEEVLAFSRNTPRHGISRSAASSPLRSRNPINTDNDIYRTPRNLVHSLQDLNNINPKYPEKQVRSRYHSPSDFEWSPVSGCDPKSILPDEYECGDGENESLYADVEQFQDDIESVSSTEDIPIDPHLQVPHQMIPEMKSDRPKAFLKFVCGLSFALLAAFTPVFLLSNQDEGCYLVPT